MKTEEFTAPEARVLTLSPSKTSQWVSRCVPGVLGGSLFLLNNLGVVHGFVAAPAGYAALGVQRHMDLAQYLTWLSGLKRAWILSNYHAPWITPAGLILPGFFPVALLERWFGLSPVLGLQLFSLGGYVATAYALAFAYRTFLRTRRQALTAFLIALACVPVAALPGVAKLLPHSGWMSAATLISLGNTAGAREYLMFSEGFLRSLITWPFITYGTCGQLLSMSLLARYCQSHQLRWFRWLAVVCCVAPLIHPFEIFVTVPVIAIVLLQEAEPARQKLKRIGIIAVSAAVGLAPHAIQSMRVPWVHDATNENRPDLGVAPAHLLGSLGIPAIVLVVLFLFGLPRNQSREVLILKTWFVVALLVFFVPGMPLSLHLLDGVLFAIGMLLTIQLQELRERWLGLPRPAVRAAAAVLLVWMIAPQVIFRARSWRDGTALKNIKFASAVAPRDEFVARDWLREHADPSDLVLADYETAPWLATAPVHAVGGHWLFSAAGIGYKLDPLRAEFFAGTLAPERAREFLDTLGVRYVIVPYGSGAESYMKNVVVRACFGATTIYEIPGARMKQYGDSKIIQLGSNGFSAGR